MAKLNFKTFIAAAMVVNTTSVFGSNELNFNDTLSRSQPQEGNPYKLEPHRCPELGGALDAINHIEKTQTQQGLETAIQDLKTLLIAKEYDGGHMSRFIRNELDHSEKAVMTVFNYYSSDSYFVLNTFWLVAVTGKESLAKRMIAADTNKYIQNPTTPGTALNQIAHTGSIQAVDLLLSLNPSPKYLSNSIITAALDFTLLADPKAFIDRLLNLNPDILDLKKGLDFHKKSGAPFIPEHQKMIEDYLEFESFKSNPGIVSLQPKDVVTLAALNRAVSEKRVFKSGKYLENARDFVATSLLGLDPSDQLTTKSIDDAFAKKDTLTKERSKKYTDAKNHLISRL